MIVRRLFLCAMLVTCLALAGPAWAGTFNFSGASLGEGNLCFDPTGGNGCGALQGTTLAVGAGGGNPGALISEVLSTYFGNDAITGGYLTLQSGALLGGGCTAGTCSYSFGAGGLLTVFGTVTTTNGTCTNCTLLTAQFLAGATFLANGTVGTYNGTLNIGTINLNPIFGTGYTFTGGSGDAITISLNNGCTLGSGGLCDGLVDQAAASLQTIPEPATLSVIGAGLLALGTGLRRKMLAA